MQFYYFTVCVASGHMAGDLFSAFVFFCSSFERSYSKMLAKKEFFEAILRNRTPSVRAARRRFLFFFLNKIF